MDELLQKKQLAEENRRAQVQKLSESEFEASKLSDQDQMLYRQTIATLNASGTSIESFVGQNQAEILAHRRVMSEKAVEELTKEIDMTSLSIEVKSSAQKEAVKEEKPGIFARIGKWISNLFKKKPADSDKPPYNGPTEEERKRLLDDFDTKNAKYAKEVSECMNNVGRLPEFQEKYGNETVPVTKTIQRSYDEYLDKFKKCGVMQKKGVSDAQAATEMQSFFREMGSPNCFDHSGPGQQFTMNVTLHSEDRIKTFFDHPDDVGVSAVIEDLLSFNAQDFLRKYPLSDAKDPEERYRIAISAKTELRQFLEEKQWYEKFGKFCSSEALKKKMDMKIAESMIFTEAFTIACRMTPISPSETLADVGAIQNYEEYCAHADELTAIATQFDQAKQEYPAMEFDESRQFIRKMRFVAPGGRLRLTGDEPVDEILAHGLEDMQYYAPFYAQAKSILKKLETVQNQKVIDRETQNRISSEARAVTIAYMALETRLRDPGVVVSTRVPINKGALPEGWLLKVQMAELAEQEKASK